MNMTDNLKRITENLLSGQNSESVQRKEHLVKAAMILAMVVEQKTIEVNSLAVEQISQVVSC